MFYFEECDPMRFILNCAFALGLLWLLPSAAKCDLVFSVAQRTPGPITLGSDAIFDLFVRSTTANQGFAQLSVEIVLEKKDGSAGRFSENGLETNLDGSWLPTGDPFLLDYLGLPNASTPSFGLSNIPIGEFVLSTAGATEGTYQILLTAVAFDGFNNIPSSGEPTTYTIAVPEPTSMALVCVAGVGALWGYRRRAKVC
jgi:hypothetical protein